MNSPFKSADRAWPIDTGYALWLWHACVSHATTEALVPPFVLYIHGSGVTRLTLDRGDCRQQRDENNNNNAATLPLQIKKKEDGSFL